MELLRTKNIYYFPHDNKNYNSPIEIRESRRIPEPLREWVRVYLELGDELILVGGDGRKHRLREDERTVLFPRQIRDGPTSVTHLHQMYSGLVPVHGV